LKAIVEIDNIPGFLLKDCAGVLSNLSFTFRLIIKTSSFPDIWKEKLICPIFRKGE
jgi:hypothetical protein